MFVSKGAVQVLREKRKGQFYDRYIRTMVDEAKRLQLSPQDIVNLIERGFEG